MSFVIAQGCCNDASCISVCPVDCIRPRPGDPQFMSAEQLYIDPDACIDCAACMVECPVGAIYDEYDMPGHLEVFKEINAEYFAENPLEMSESVKTTRRKLTKNGQPLRVAVIGSGPSGCYAADQLSAVSGVEVSLFDRLPTPYGLARAGVAPDHQSTKKITKLFDKIIRRPNVTCYFNVDVGKHVSVSELLEHHHAVVVAVGADSDRRLGIEGEDLPGSYPVRKFVAWYNGHPDHRLDEFDLSGERVVIVGNGNVALDAARMLVSDIDRLESSDMAEQALDALRHSGVREVVIAARRGVLDAAYTTSELMALGQMEGVDLVVVPEEVTAAKDDTRRDQAQVRRKYDLAAAAVTLEEATAARRIVLRYGLTPVSINGEHQVKSVSFCKTETPDDLDSVETIEAGLVLQAIGFRSSPIEGVPFDERAGTISHIEGRVYDGAGAVVSGLYCVGWAKRGPSGVIGTNQVCAIETVAGLFDDFEAGTLPDTGHPVERFQKLIAERQPEYIDHAGWLKIDAVERHRGSAASKPRVKFVSIDEMLTASRT
ncbi:FAD-dependent oxidoreductase [Rhodococcus rhodochrous]|nr:FAD-dependent oxidoreductase [Rhodococcus rhodochrous]